ncbi:MAG: hypothetical protein P9M06_01470 [Candidatus Saelkia tenebricola]|nr:hypothetical protein [Candidatus Saelkia tenebricola]
MSKKLLVIGVVLLVLLWTYSAQSSQITRINEDYKTATIDLGSEKGYLVAGTQLYVLSPQDTVKGIIELGKIGRSTSNGKITKTYSKIVIGDKVVVSSNPFLLKKGSIDYHKVFILDKQGFLSFIKNHPGVKTLDYQNNMFQDQAKKAGASFFPKLDAQHVRGHNIQEGRRTRDGAVSDLALDVLTLYQDLSFAKSAHRKYYICMVGKNALELKKFKSELILHFFHMVNFYVTELKKILSIDIELENLQQELKQLQAKENIYPYLLECLETKIIEKKQLLKITRNTAGELFGKIHLALNLTPDTELIFPKPKEFLAELKNILQIPKNGFNLLLAEYELTIKESEYTIAKANIRPSAQLKIGYPSYVSSYKLIIPITGWAAVKAAELEEKQADCILNQEYLRTTFEIKRISTELHFSKKLLLHYQEFKQKILQLTSDYWQDKLDIKEKAARINDRIEELNSRIRELDIEFLKYGDIKTAPEIVSDQFLPSLKDCLKYARKMSPESKYLWLEAQKSFEFLKESKARHNTAKYNFYKDEYAYKAVLKQLKNQEIQSSLTKDYLELLENILDYQTSFKLTDIYLREYEIKKEGKKIRPYLIENSKLIWEEELIKQTERELLKNLSWLKLKYRLSDLGKPDLETYSTIQKNILKETAETISNMEFDSNIRNRIQKFKILLAVDSIEIAKKGYWIKGPWEVVYTPQKIPTRGRRGRDWKKITHGSTIADWIAIYIPTGIIHRTIFGEKIHDVKIAHTNLEIAKIYLEQEKIQEEHLKYALSQTFSSRKENLQTAKLSSQKAKSKYLQTESRVKKLQAREIDLLANKRILLEKELSQIKKLQLFLASKIDVLDRGEVEKKVSGKTRPLPTILTEIPKLKIVEKEAVIAKERYKRAIKLNFSDILKIGRLSAGPWFLLKIFPDINIIRANHMTKETPLWIDKATIDAELEFQNWLTRVQTAKVKINSLTILLHKMESYLQGIQNEISLSTAPYSHYIELDLLKEEIKDEINSEQEKELYALMQLKTLANIPLEETLLIPDIKIPYKQSLQLAKPDNLISITAQHYPDVKLANSQLSLAYKEKKWDPFLRNLQFGVDFLCDVITTRSYAWSITFNIFNLPSHHLGRYYEDKIQYQNLSLGSTRLKIKKDVYLKYYLAHNYHNQSIEFKKILDNYNSLLGSAWTSYLNKEIPWESEYGLLKIFRKIFTFQNLYIENLQEYSHNLNYYNELERKYLDEKEAVPLSIAVPFSTLTIQNIALNKVTAKILQTLSNLKQKFSLFKHLNLAQKTRAANRHYWQEKEQKSNFNLFSYQVQKSSKKAALDKIANIYDQAQEREYQSFLAMEKLWEQDHKDYTTFKKKMSVLIFPPLEEKYTRQIQRTIEEIKPGIQTEQSLFAPFDENDLYNGLTNYFLKHLRNLRFSEKEIELFFSNMPQIASIWKSLRGEKTIKLAGWWSKYSGGFTCIFLLPYFEPNDVNEIGLIAHYSLISVLNQNGSKNPQNVLTKIKSRLYDEKKFLLVNLRTIPQDSVSQYLQWQNYTIEEIDKILFQHFSYNEVENMRKQLAKLKVPFWQYTEGNKLEEQLQTDIIRWLITSGNNNKEKIAQLFQSVPQILYQIYKDPSLEEISHSYDAVRLRHLLTTNDTNNIKAEYKRVKTSYMIGLLLFWLNKMHLENISIEELKTIVKEVMVIKKQPEFISLYGDHSLTDEQYLFYQHSLIYHAQKNLTSSSPKNPDKIFYWINLLKNQPEFISLYGNIDFNSPFIYEKLKPFQISHYTGNLSFWAHWAIKNKFEKEFVKNFLSLLNRAMKEDSFGEHLENIYRKIGITISLSLKNKSYEMRKEIYGITSNWILYFYLRGMTSWDQILFSLNEISAITNLSLKYRLNYSQDDLRYWFQHKNESGYTMKELEQIFYLMSRTKTILIKSIEELYRMDEISPHISKLKPYLEEIKNKKMHPGEIQRLAEEILYPQKVSIKDLIEEYKIGVLIQALYLAELNIELTPYDITEIFTFFKKEGLNIDDLIQLIKTEQLVYQILGKNELAFIFREPELRKFIWQNTYNRGWESTSQYFKKWAWKLTTFLKEFKQEHGSHPPKRLLYVLLDRHIVNAPDWQMRRLIHQGNLSQESKNPLIVNLGENWNIKRELLFFCYEHLPIGIDADNLNSLIYYFLNLNFYDYSHLLELEKKFEENMAQTVIANGTPYLEDRMKKIMPLAFPMLRYFYQKESVFKERISGFSKRSKNGFKSIVPNTSFQEMLNSPEKRIAIIKRVQDAARKYYNVELSPARTYSIIWKMREGYQLEDALRIFIGNYRQLKNIYKTSASKEITGNISNLLLHLSQQIYLTPLEIKDCEKIFLIMRQLQIIKTIGNNVLFEPSQDYRNAESIYFTGLEAKDLNKITGFLKKTDQYLPQEQRDTTLYLCLKSFKSQPYYIPGIAMYDYKDYYETLGETDTPNNKLISYLNKNNISPQGYYYIYSSAKHHASNLGLSSKFKKYILAFLLYEKTKDPQIVKIALDLKTDAEVYACLNKIDKILAKKKRTIIKRNILEECRF